MQQSAYKCTLYSVLFPAIFTSLYLNIEKRYRRCQCARLYLPSSPRCPDPLLFLTGPPTQNLTLPHPSMGPFLTISLICPFPYHPVWPALDTLSNQGMSVQDACWNGYLLVFILKYEYAEAPSGHVMVSPQKVKLVPQVR